MLFLFFIYFNLDGQTGKYYSSRWQTGDNKEITTNHDEYSFNKKSKLYYIVSNDITSIYITLKVEDKVVLSRILREGLIIWVDMDNSLDKNMGIRFPIGSENIENPRMHDFSENNSDTEKNIDEALTLASTIELTGFKQEPYKRFPAENRDSFSAYVKIDEHGVLLYRLAIPLEKIPVRNARDGRGTMPFTIGAEYGNATSSGGALKKDSKSKPAMISSQSSHPPVITWIKNIKLAEEK